MPPNLRILLEEASTFRQPNNGLTRQQKALSKGLADVAMRKQRHSYHHATPSTQGAAYDGATGLLPRLGLTTDSPNKSAE